MAPDPGQLYRGPEVCRLVGISYRQLDYWARTGLVVPSVPARGSGTQRGYSEHDVAVLVLVAGLLRAGMSLQAARRAAGVLAEVPHEMWSTMEPVAVTPAGAVHLSGECSQPVYLMVDLSRCEPRGAEHEGDLLAASA